MRFITRQSQGNQCPVQTDISLLYFLGWWSFSSVNRKEIKATDGWSRLLGVVVRWREWSWRWWWLRQVGVESRQSPLTSEGNTVGGHSSPKSGDSSPLGHQGGGGGHERLHDYDIKAVVHDVPGGSHWHSFSPILVSLVKLMIWHNSGTRSLHLSKKIKQEDYSWLDGSFCTEHVYQFWVNEWG